MFAALPLATSLFTGAQVYVEDGDPRPSVGTSTRSSGSENNTPGPPNLFGAAGSFICFTVRQAERHHLVAHEDQGSRRSASSRTTSLQSTDCASGAKNSFEKYKTAKVVFDDESLGFGNPDFSAQVAADGRSRTSTSSSRASTSTGSSTCARRCCARASKQRWCCPTPTSTRPIEENQEFLNGLYVATLFAPLETKPKPPGVKLFQKWMKKTGGRQSPRTRSSAGSTPIEFVTALKAAGPDFTRQKVIDAINQITDYTANGFVPPVDWTTAHENDQDCMALLKIVDGKFKPVFGKPGKPFICFADDLDEIPKNPEVR